MGWWKVRDSEIVVGDEPFGILRVATRQVLDTYRREFDRNPTRAEWECLLEDSLNPIDLAEADQPKRQTSMFAEGGEPTAVSITLRPRELKEPDVSKVARTCRQIARTFGYEETVGQSDAFVRELLFGKYDLWASLDEALITRDEFLSAVLVRFLDWARTRSNHPIDAISRDSYENELVLLSAAIFGD